MRIFILATLFAALLTTSVRADTLDVPAEYPTIQAAIVAAAPGDLVLVAPGTYVEMIDFLGKAITVEGSGGAAVTTIDGGGAGSVVTCESLESNASILRGFTVTGGTGSAAFTTFVVGGGLKLINGSPTIQDCVITGNSAADMGGGVFVSRSTYPPADAPLLEDCVISNNSTGPSSSYSIGGGGIAVFPYFSGALLEGCTLAGNSTHGSGGGFAIPDRGGLTLIDCVITGNTAAKTGGGGSVQGCCSGTFLKMDGCTVAGNQAALGGGGLSGYVAGDGGFSFSSIEVNRCRFSDNSATTSGGGLSVSAATFGFATVSNCLIVDNSATGVGGGIAAGGYGFINVLNCTVTRNTAAVNGGISGYSSSYAPQGCIVWGNEGGQFSWGPVIPSYCDIEGGHPGIGNIDIDPQFLDPDAGDFHLASTSACLDAGNPSSSAFGTDIDGDPRVLFGRIDIGADESTTPKSPWTFLGHALAGTNGAPSLEGTGELTPGAETTLALGGALPGAPSWIIAGGDSDPLPFKGGLLLPVPHWVVGPVLVGPAGTAALSGRWPIGLPTGFVVTVQSWIADPGGPGGFAASNGLAAKSQ